MKVLNRIVGMILCFGFAAMMSCTSEEPRVMISTEYGDMIVELRDDTPLHKANFLKLIKEGYYNDLLFHRVMNRFMIQGGDPDSKTAAAGQQLGQGGPGYTTVGEFTGGLHIKGALAAARAPDVVNPQKESSGSQFYIAQGEALNAQNLDMHLARNPKKKYTEEEKQAYLNTGVGVPFLDDEYTVFGQVVEGLDVIDKIAAVSVDPAKRPHQDIKMTVSIVK